MKTLIKNGTIVNVFTSECEAGNVLILDEKIIGVGDYTDSDADEVIDASGKYICPGFIDGHIHIESTMLSPGEFVRTTLPHGTTSVVTDPHEIANVLGTDGIKYMLEASEGLPQSVYVMLSSCVPSTRFCESGAVLEAEDLEPLYDSPRVLGLAEVMNYVGIIADDEKLAAKISSAKKRGKRVNGHAPLLTGRDLDKYLSYGIADDHECSGEQEAKERIRKGQRILIRQGTAAKNLKGLISLFERPWADRCLLVSDDKHPDELLKKGHIDDAIRLAVSLGASAVTAIKMATLNAAEHYKLDFLGAIAPGYIADALILDSLENIGVQTVIYHGKVVAENGKAIDFSERKIEAELENKVRSSFHLNELSAENFAFRERSVSDCRVIGVIPGELITEEKRMTVDFSKNSGVDVDRDILKLAVIERHKGTGHIGLGFITGVGLREGAIAASVSHDSHNLIVIGTNDADMAFAANRVRELGGGSVAVRCGEVLGEVPLAIAGLMSDLPASQVAEQNRALRETVRAMGVKEGVDPFMNMAFVGLPVIPFLKLTTLGLIDVTSQKTVPLVYGADE